jgi:hypothetical protein
MEIKFPNTDQNESEPFIYNKQFFHNMTYLSQFLYNPQ